MRRRTQTLAVAALLAAGLLVAGLWMSVPYITLVPGPVIDTLGTTGGKPLIEISGTKTYPPKGRLQLTTVEELPRLTLLSAVRDWFAADRAVVPRELLQQPGKSREQVEQENTQQMLDSQDEATAAALSQLKIKPKSTYLAVFQVSKGAPADGKLRAGDRLVAVDGTAVVDQPQLVKLIGRVKPGQPVVVTYRRGTKDAMVTITTTRSPTNPKQPIIGVLTTEKQVYPFTVKIGLKDVGGPSAGLMFALGIVDLLTPGDLTNGASVAGTGTIDPGGTVGPIGGIQQKLLGARHNGASVFLVPAGNCDEARGAAPKGLRLVKVNTLSGALDDLADLKAGRSSAVPAC
jgi:PDZ domain-containing protein